jgi:hypothetical protein
MVAGVSRLLLTILIALVLTAPAAAATARLDEDGLFVGVQRPDPAAPSVTRVELALPGVVVDPAAMPVGTVFASGVLQMPAGASANPQDVSIECATAVAFVRGDAGPVVTFSSGPDRSPRCSIAIEASAALEVAGQRLSFDVPPALVHPGAATIRTRFMDLQLRFPRGVAGSSVPAPPVCPAMASVTVVLFTEGGGTEEHPATTRCAHPALPAIAPRLTIAGRRLTELAGLDDVPRGTGVTITCRRLCSGRRTLSTSGADRLRVRDRLAVRRGSRLRVALVRAGFVGRWMDFTVRESGRRLLVRATAAGCLSATSSVPTRVRCPADGSAASRVRR